MLAAEFEPAILASERPQTHPLDSPATGVGFELILTVDVLLSSLFRCTWPCSNFPTEAELRAVLCTLGRQTITNEYLKIASLNTESLVHLTAVVSVSAAALLRQCGTLMR